MYKCIYIYIYIYIERERERERGEIVQISVHFNALRFQLKIVAHYDCSSFKSFK